jgi:pimeloyl-ACP methyl ester carboxylesterase
MVGRKVLIAVIVVAAAVAALVFLGPRVPVDTTISFDAGSLGDDLDRWLEEREGAVAGIREGLSKEIVWADPAARNRTPLAIVYVHGFSASKGEIRPVPDIVARELGANLFYSRLTGHGQDGAAMADASVNDWINDYAEAIAIGRRLGERVVVVATSTGASIASWAASQPALSADVAGMVLVSPNYGVQTGGSFLLTMPWGGWLAERILGPERGFEPRNELHRRYWTTRYPTAAILPMAATVALARDADFENARVPALFVFSDDDRIVRPDLTRGIAERWSAAHDLFVIEDTGDASSHVIAGDALSPSTSETVADAIAQWVRSLP